MTEVVPEGTEGVRRYFFLSWEHNYDVFVGEQKFFVLGTQKQQYVRPTRAAKQLRARLAQEESEELKQEADKLASELGTLAVSDDE